MQKLRHFLKVANSTALASIYETRPHNSTSLNEALVRTPQTPKGLALKLTTNNGKKRPSFIHKRETNSPYNPN